jgi:hypothetical protein
MMGKEEHPLWSPHQVTQVNALISALFVWCGSRGGQVEVGGGGHSMSDLWGVYDTLSQQYNRRVCSFDPPGTGWSVT